MERKKKITIGIAALVAVALIGGGVGYTVIENNAKQTAFTQASTAYSEADKAYSGMQTTAEKSVVENCDATVADTKTCATLDEALKQAKDLSKPSEVVKGKSKKDYNELKTALAKNREKYEKLNKDISSALEQVKTSQKTKTEADKKTTQPQTPNNNTGSEANYNGNNSSNGYSGGNSGANYSRGTTSNNGGKAKVYQSPNGNGFVSDWSEGGTPPDEFCLELDTNGNQRHVPCP